MKKITERMLWSRGACADQLDKFATMFPDGAVVTAENCEAVSSEFDWAWASNHLLNPSARAEYDRVRASARAEHDRTCAPAWAEYARMCAPAHAKYDLVYSARADYDLVYASARAEYDRVRARTFATVYLAQ